MCFPVRGGGQTVPFAVWVADAQDECILGLDPRRAVGLVLDLKDSTLTLPGGQCVQLTSGSTCAGPTMAIANATDATTQQLAQSQWAVEEVGGIAAVIWDKNCEGLTQEQRGRLWEVLLEFKDGAGLIHMVKHHIDTWGCPPH